MDWFKAYHGMPFDPRWILAARRAGNGATPGHIYAVWGVLLDVASRSRPRGSITTFDAEAVAASFGWPDNVITAAYDGLQSIGCHDGESVMDWERQQAKKDPTNAERQRKHRVKVKGDTERNALRDVTVESTESDRNALRNTEEREERESLFERPSVQASKTSTSNHPLRIARAEEIWQSLGDAGIPVHVIARHLNGKAIGGWLRDGIAVEHLRDAIARAQRARQRAGSDQPLNIGFVDGFVRDVMTGTPERGATHGNERGDQLSRAFASR